MKKISAYLMTIQEESQLATFHVPMILKLEWISQELEILWLDF